MRPRIYVDLSVFGGCEDIEFIGHSRRLVAAMASGDYAMVISEVTLLELEKAPVAVRAHLERIPICSSRYWHWIRRRKHLPRNTFRTEP